jgi:hypothetical protein
MAGFAASLIAGADDSGSLFSTDGTWLGMITVSELEAIIAQTLPGEQVQYEGKPIGSVDQMTRKLTELKLKRSGDPDYLIFVGINRFVGVLFNGLLNHGRPAGISFTARQAARSCR